MKRLSVLLLCALALAGCARFQAAGPVVQSYDWAAAAKINQQASDPSLETLAFTLGVSSATVEKMGRSQSCRSEQGAGLVTPVGPVEVYRMRCEGGKTLLARCEQRQCKMM